MEGATSGRRPDQEQQRRQGLSHRRDGRISSKENLAFKGKGGNRHPSERLREKGSVETQEGSRSGGVVTRQKRGRSPDGSPDSWHKRKGNGEMKARGRPSPAHETAKDKPDSSRAGLHRRPGSAHIPRRLQDWTTRFRSPLWARGGRRCQPVPETQPSSPKRRRCHLSAEARAPLAALTSRLCNQVGALEVGLGELLAPGGAFLPVSRRRTEPTASQRAWLTWQLAHAGAALHWALAALDSLLAARPGPSSPLPSPPGAPWL
ncbi:hypothetical protein Cadr_000016061 [Camelus dromedarius]|uniref:Uncharacterized protein n=1 Tax=Camelus dromedarius TaxID=9838 RepID=A0A5N4EA91_CAMDR|nr:hypothetical protein Cadr_000016061 [Camelus dromedarius]